MISPAPDPDDCGSGIVPCGPLCIARWCPPGRGTDEDHDLCEPACDDGEAGKEAEEADDEHR